MLCLKIPIRLSSEEQPVPSTGRRLTGGCFYFHQGRTSGVKTRFLVSNFGLRLQKGKGFLMNAESAEMMGLRGINVVHFMWSECNQSVFFLLGRL